MYKPDGDGLALRIYRCWDLDFRSVQGMFTAACARGLGLKALPWPVK